MLSMQSNPCSRDFVMNRCTAGGQICRAVHSLVGAVTSMPQHLHRLNNSLPQQD